MVFEATAAAADRQTPGEWLLQALANQAPMARQPTVT
jgi:hypothetical protein